MSPYCFAFKHNGGAVEYRCQTQDEILAKEGTFMGPDGWFGCFDQFLARM
jgi:hypothetical protein